MSIPTTQPTVDDLTRDAPKPTTLRREAAVGVPATPSASDAEPKPQGATTLVGGGAGNEEEDDAFADDAVFAFEAEHGTLGRSRRPNPPAAPPADDVSSGGECDDDDDDDDDDNLDDQDDGVGGNEHQRGVVTLGTSVPISIPRSWRPQGPRGF